MDSFGFWKLTDLKRLHAIEECACRILAEGILIGHEAGIGVVLVDELEISVVEVETIDVVPLRIAIVEADQDRIVDCFRGADDLDAGVLEGGEADLLAAFEVLQVDDYGVTFAWRLLETKKVGRRP